MPATSEFDVKTATLETVTAIEPGQSIAVDIIADIVKHDRQELQHGELFTGRPSTGIIASDSHVLKLHKDLSFSAADCLRWIERKVSNERDWAIYHPAKTWLLLRHGEKAMIANITPRLTPLHVGLETLSDHQRLDCFRDYAQMYCRLATEHNRRLDEGLSNFAMDTTQHLYYLDDDIYRWDRFTAFTQVAATWFRRFAWLTPELAEQLGKVFRDGIMTHFNDHHWLAVIHRQLRLPFMANETQRERRDSFLRGLALPKQIPNKQHHEFPSTPIKRPQSDETIAILADIHGNYPALKAVLQLLKKWDIHSGVVLGDTVGYGPHPHACISALQQSGFITIKGNHDHGLVTGNLSKGFSVTGRWVLEWSRQQVSSADIAWLEALALYHEEKNWIAVHGAPLDSTFFNAYVYHMTYEKNLDYLAQNNIPICFHGHTHVQGSYIRQQEDSFFSSEQELDLTTVDHALVCPGSIGQPRSEKVGAEFAVYNPVEKKIKFFRIDYDLDLTVAEMRRHAFPEQLVTRLQAGI